MTNFEFNYRFWAHHGCIDLGADIDATSVPDGEHFLSGQYSGAGRAMLDPATADSPRVLQKWIACGQLVRPYFKLTLVEFPLGQSES